MATRNKYAYAAVLLVQERDPHFVQERYRFNEEVMYEVEQAADALRDGDHERFHMLIQNLTKLYGS